jgi:uncharacterized protein (TIRG00374 family)
MNERSKKRSLWISAISFLLAAILLFFALRGIDWAGFVNTIRTGQYEILLLVIPIGSLNYFFRAFRWKVLLHANNKLSTITVFWANMVGYLGNAFLPARTGEILRSAYLGKESQLGISYVLATALVERVIDMLALILIGSLSLVQQDYLSANFITAIKTMSGVAILGFAFIVILPFQEERVLRLWTVIPIPEKVSRKISEQISRFLLGMRSLQNFRRIFKFILLTGVIWLVDGCSAVLGARVISKSLDLGQALILLSALGLSSAIPSTPGYLGVYQFVAVNVLRPFDFSSAEAISYILIVQIVNYLIVSFWGLIGMWKLNKVQEAKHFTGTN